MTWPEKDHPAWKLAQSIVALVGLAILVFHGIDGGHAGGVDVEDGAGVAALGLAGKLVYQALKG